MWIADTGDNDETRPDVLLARLIPPAGEAENWRYDYLRLTYPDGPRNSEALFVAPEGTPYLITRDLAGHAEVFRAAVPRAVDSTVALELVGEITLTPTGTGGGPIGRLGEVLITGAAMSRDGGYLAVRTYTDAYLWPVPTTSGGGSDVAAGVSVPPALVVGLPDSPQGEAITFAGDDRSLLLASEGVGSDIALLPATPGLLDGTVGAGAEDSDAGQGSSADAAPLTDSGDPAVSGVEPITAAVLIGAVAVAVGAIVVLVNRSRRRR